MYNNKQWLLDYLNMVPETHLWIPTPPYIVSAIHNNWFEYDEERYLLLLNTFLLLSTEVLTKEKLKSTNGRRF